MRKTVRIAILLLVTLGIVLYFNNAQPAQDQVSSSIQLERPLGWVELENGDILVTDGGGIDWHDANSKVLIINKKKEVVWSFSAGLRFAHSAIPLQNGNILIPDTNNDRLLEVNRTGEIIWTSESWGEGTGRLNDHSHLHYPNYVQELANGHFLVSDRLNSRVIEVDRTGTIHWTFSGAAKQHAPKYIGDGRYLIADSDGNRIIEVDQTGKVLWSFAQGLSWPREAVRLANGDTLITDSQNHRILTVSPTGEIVSEIKGFLATPYQAGVLRNGNYLICDSQHARLVEVNKRGKILWEFRNLDDHNLPRSITNGDVERIDAAGAPVGWTVCNMVAKEAGEWLVDTEVFQPGKHSLTIRSEEKMLLSKWWGQRLSVEPGSQVQLSAMIKTKEAQGVTIALGFMDDLGGPKGGVNIPVINGTRDWHNYVLIAEVPTGVTKMSISLLLNGAGQVWFDDLILTQSQ